VLRPKLAPYFRRQCPSVFQFHGAHSRGVKIAHGARGADRVADRFGAVSTIPLRYHNYGVSLVCCHRLAVFLAKSKPSKHSLGGVIGPALRPLAGAKRCDAKSLCQAPEMDARQRPVLVDFRENFG